MNCTRIRTGTWSKSCLSLPTVHEFRARIPQQLKNFWTNIVLGFIPEGTKWNG
jgi:hypothetical protein